jgi:uncharacterized protein YutE (UPF0331/DUF86 family)
MTYLVERLAELRRHLDHPREIRNVLVHDYVGLDLDRVVEALDSLAPVERYFAIVHGMASEALPG